MANVQARRKQHAEDTSAIAAQLRVYRAFRMHEISKTSVNLHKRHKRKQLGKASWDNETTPYSHMPLGCNVSAPNLARLLALHCHLLASYTKKLLL
jgi:hypothetical protein